MENLDFIVGLKGWFYILIENNVYGCKEFNVNVDKNLWIVFIERGVCNFKEKIRNVYKYNVIVVIIYDYEDRDDEIIMFYDDVDYFVVVSIMKIFGEDLV